LSDSLYCVIRLPLCLTICITPEFDRPNRLHAHNHHELVYILEGSGSQATDHLSYAVKPGQFYLFPAGVRHVALCRTGEEQRIFVLSIPPHLFGASAGTGEEDLAAGWNRLIEYARGRHLIELEGTVERPAATLVERMRDEFARKPAGYNAAIRLAFSDLLLLMMRSAWWEERIPEAAHSPSPRGLVAEAESYVQANWNQDIGVAEVLEFCNLSRSHFHALFKKFTGKTFVEYLRSVRIERAADRLSSSEDSIGTIAADCGFTRAAYFSSIFRGEMGMSPREYRRRLQSRLGAG
jgi:AraC-like DNA-binding protein